MVRKHFIIIMVLFLLPLCIYGRTIRVGVANFEPPFTDKVDSTHYDGFDISMIRYICKKINYECELVPYKKNQLLQAVESGEVDMAASQLIVSNESAAHVKFSIPYLVNVTRILGSKKLVKGHFEMELLNNQKIGVSEEAYIPQIAELKLKNANVILFDQDEELIKALYNGDIGFALVDAYSASYWNVNSSQRIVDCGSSGHFDSVIAIAVNPKDNDLLERINWALTSYLNSQDFLDNYNKYLHYF